MRRARRRFNAFVVLVCCLTAAGLAWSTVSWSEPEQDPRPTSGMIEGVRSVSVPRPG